MKIDKEKNLALKITLVFAAITSTFAFLGKLITLIPLFDDLNPKLSIGNFIKVNIVWLSAAFILILCIYFYIKKLEGEFNGAFLQNPMIRLTVGLLIIFEGIIDLSNKVPILILNIQTFHHAASKFGDKFDGIVNISRICDAIQILIYLIQVLLGLFFVLYKKKSKDKIGQ